jgi:membrane protease subunit (stomatin/prohibitin family)
MTDIFAPSEVAFLDMAANQAALAQKIAEQLRPAFHGLGLELDQFIVENISLPDELQKVLDQRIGMNMVGDLGRYTQFETAQAVPVAAANAGGVASIGVGLGAGAAMAQSMMNAVKSPATGVASPPSVDTRFCIACGQAIPKHARFCWECGKPQQ